MHFEYRKTALSQMEGDFGKFDHALYYRAPVGKFNTAYDNLSSIQYRAVAEQLVEVIGPGIELWDYSKKLIPDETVNLDDVHWAVISLVPTIFTFRTEEHAIIAKLALVL